MPATFALATPALAPEVVVAAGEGVVPAGETLNELDVCARRARAAKRAVSSAVAVAVLDDFTLEEAEFDAEEDAAPLVEEAREPELAFAELFEAVDAALEPAEFALEADELVDFEALD